MKEKFTMKIKLSFFKDSPRFFINEEKKTVTCIMEGKINPIGGYMYVGIAYPFKNVKGIGVAKCNPQDKFDPEIGKAIARARAESDAYLKAVRNLKNEKELVCDYFSELVRFESRAYNCAAHNDTYVQRVIDEYNSQKQFIPIDKADGSSENIEKPIEDLDIDMPVPPDSHSCEGEVDETDDGMTVQIHRKKTFRTKKA